MSNTINGSQVKRVYSLGSGYGWEYLQMEIEGEYYRMKVSELMKVLGVIRFTVEQKKKYKHLVIEGMTI